MMARYIMLGKFSLDGVKGLIKSSADRASEAKSVIGNIDNAAKMYYQTYGEWPTDVEELENSGQLEVDRSTKRKWVFELQLSDQGGRIIATSTGDMDGGEGRVVEFDRESGDYRGYGTAERES